MLQIVVRSGSARAFCNGVSAANPVPFDYDVPLGHYELTQLDGGYVIRGLTARDISGFAVNGFRYGIRARWLGDLITVNGFAAPLSSFSGSVAIDGIVDSVSGFSLCILSVIGYPEAT